MTKIEGLYWRIYYTIKDWMYEVKWAYQRVFRGYDDLATWNLESHIAELVNKVTLDMADNSVGYPNGLTEKKWKEILQQISFGFGSYIEMRSGFYLSTDPEYKRLKKEFHKGMVLFAKHFGSLWD
jgi:hypothetical protein